MTEQEHVRIHVAAIQLANVWMLNPGMTDECCCEKARELTDLLIKEMAGSIPIGNPIDNKTAEMEMNLGNCDCKVKVVLHAVSPIGLVDVTKPDFLSVQLIWCEKHQRLEDKGEQDD